MMHEKYSLLRQDFLSIADSFVDSDVLDQLKHNYAHEIDSKRKLSKVKDLGMFIKLLEKRDVINYNNIEQLWYISKTYIGKPYLENKLLEYEKWLQTALPSSFYNMYQSDYTSVSAQKQGNTAENVTLISESHNHTTQKSHYCSEQEEKENNKRKSLQQAVMLQLSEKLGRSWRDVARYLGIRECEIDSVQNKYPNDLKEQSYKILNIYILQSDREQWAINLIRALEKGRRRDLRELVEEMILIYKDI